MKRKNAISMALAAAMLTAAVLPGCGADENSGKTEIEILQYKPEAAAYFDKVEEEFNASHDDIHLTISSPNDASTSMPSSSARAMACLEKATVCCWVRSSSCRRADAKASPLWLPETDFCPETGVSRSIRSIMGPPPS